MAYVTVCTSRGIRTPTINQSERGYGVRHGVYVRCFNQSERGYGVRHGVYVTGDTYAVLTNQSTGIAYVTACTYAFRPIRARYSNEGAPPQYVCAPLARPLRPPCAPHGVYVTGDTYAVLTNQSTGIAYVTACTYAFRPIRARYSNEGAPPQYVCAPLARPLRPPCAPHGVYVTGDTYAVLTNQSTGIAYVTACTYAFRPIRARYSNEGAPPQYVCAPLARPLRPPRPPCAPLKIRLDRPLYYYSPHFSFLRHSE